METPIAVGTRVEVRNRFEAAFCPGFEVSRIDGGYLVKRISDGVELPATFSYEEIRIADR
jgi:hypothetical protein